ncbi:MAG TPA: hypothetical protein ENN69_03055 [Spirochaetia bacterium]|nr:hypothetical protein [Spirochaetia bacterium]
MQLSRDSFQAMICTMLEESISFLQRAPAAPGVVRPKEPTLPASPRQVALLVQFIGVQEGELMLLTSRETASAFARACRATYGGSTTSAAEMHEIKHSLGELLNIVSSRLLSRVMSQNSVQRVTTPSCLFGTALELTPSVPSSLSAAVITPFGQMEVILTPT